MRSSLVLASASPRRQELLRALGLDFSVVPADVDESRRRDEKPIDYVERVARDKAMAVVAKLGFDDARADVRDPGRRLARDRSHNSSESEPDRVVVLAADTTVDVDGDVLGKPLDAADAERMLRLLSGRTHQVHTAVVAWRTSALEQVTVTTDVTFVDLDDATIGWYLSTGEYADKAGAYGMQGAAGALVERLDGSPTNVIGLPLAETVALLRRCGVQPA